MTTDSPRSRKNAGPSIHVVRARKLLFGGLAGGLSAAVICLIIFGVVGGGKGLGSAALGAGMVLFFYAVGQLVMVGFADAGARSLMAVSMASYTGRVVVLGLILMIFEKNRDAWQAINANTIFITTIAVIVGWLVVEVLVFRKLRIGIYDTEYSGPAATTAEDAAAAADQTGDAVDAGSGQTAADRRQDGAR
ncbi:MAG: hypothetical protein J2P23_12140 [Microlunatus sp.]|nr:hypothetical protein [Microlunatus sp.]